MRLLVLLIFAFLVGYLISDYYEISNSKKKRSFHYSGEDTLFFPEKLHAIFIFGKDTMVMSNDTIRYNSYDSVVIKDYDPSPITSKNDTTVVYGVSGN